MKKQNFLNIDVIIVIAVFFFIGIAIGMSIEQIIIVHGAERISEALSGNQINVSIDFNETNFVNELNKSLVPRLLEQASQLS